MNKPIVRSPVNQTGRKFKIIRQILPHVPKHNLLLDVFGGGGDVSANIQHNTIFNDNCKPLVEWMKVLYNEVPENILYNLDMYSDAYGLSRQNKAAYYFMRDRYNETKDNPYLFYLLHTQGFSNGIRFNSKGGWNLSFGKRYFNDTMRANLKSFVQVWQLMNIEFQSKDFTELDYSKPDLIYFDPPYFNMGANYNTSWGLKEDTTLLTLLDDLDTQGKHWMMSNVFENNDFKNIRLENWAKRYKTVHIDSDYNNASANRKTKDSVTDEVLVMNF